MTGSVTGSVTGGGAWVLLVDDEPLVMRLLSRGIEAMGVRTRFARNGPEALETLETLKAAGNAPPALILTDYYMPGMTGVELAGALVQAGLKRCPVILLSGEDDSEIVQRGLAAGVDDFLVKGMPFSVLTERVRFWSEGPFRALPQHMRRAALKTMERLAPPHAPVQRLRQGNPALVDRAALVMADQLLHAGPGFGGAEAERVRFLAVLDRVLAILARTCMVAQLQRADALVQTVQRLNRPWAEALLTAELPRLEELQRTDKGFAQAAATLSVSVK